MKKKNYRKIAFLQSLFVAFSCVVASCSENSMDNTPKIAPKYLLSGTLSSSNTLFDFYLLDTNDANGNPQYAISLKDKIGETKKTEYTSDIVINSTTCDGLNVTGIWHNSFHNCPSSNITIDLPITTIDFEAFLYSGITSITIPWSIQQIGDCAFYACSNLTKVNFVSDGNASSASATTCSQCVDNSCDDDICTGEGGSSSSNPSSSAPSASNSSAAASNNSSSSSGSGGSSQSSKLCTLTKIPSFCFFKCNSMTELVLPSSLEEIEEEAFNGCYSLESTIFFQNIRYIRQRAFQGCNSIRKIYISKSMFELQSTKRGIIEAHAFNYCADDLDIRFCATQTNINNWLSYTENGVRVNNTWGLNKDRENSNYTYNREDADLYFTSDWSYKMASNGDITINKYNGPIPTQGFITIPDKLPNPTGYTGENRVVRLDVNIFDSNVKLALQRLYLPTTLTAIDPLMFRYGYDNLYVVDDNCACYTDYNAQSITGRIDLSGLTNLKFIGIRAFSGIGGTTACANIKTLHLPSHLLAIGDEAFGIFPNRMLPGLIELIWDYESDSCLECIGADAFYGLGASGSGEIEGNSTRITGTKPSTIIFPKTFKYFGILSNTDNNNINNDVKRYKDNYNFDFTKIKNETGSKVAKPAHAFAGCSLLGKVIFKGGAGSENLVIPLQTFVYNENLHTIVFEERPGKYIAFHTQSRNSHWGQESIGGNSGRGRNDFRGGPFLHTLVLPNKETTLYIQDFSFHANSRAALYLSGNLGENMYSDIGGGSDNWINLKFATNCVAIDAANGARQWKTIGNENWYPSRNRAQYYGYNFSAKATTQADTDKSLNTFSIEQEMPVYENVYYKDPEVTDVVVGSGNTKKFQIKDKCSFICETVNDKRIATMTNYLYNLYDDATDFTTVKVPETVSITGEENSYSVKKIGDSAFSACFCDRTDSVDNEKVAEDGDLNHVILPNTIESIGEYAFMRAYGIQKISSYTGSDNPIEGMPSSLRHIGKNAFLFSGIKQVLRIPYKCLFYESENDTTKITSVFANALSLRKITFIDTDTQNATESTSSTYYKTTTYISNREGGPEFTTALYSKNYTDAQGVTTYNKNKLMLVLNRDYADRAVASIPVSPETASDATVVGSGNTAGVKFDGLYKIDGSTEPGPFLFGAFKMGVWIQSLICGNPTTYVENNVTKTYPQPLFSPVGQRKVASGTGTTGGELIDRYFYLGANADNTQNSNLKIAGNNIQYENLDCDVATISGKILKLPQYAMNGCEQLKRVEFENETGGVIPDGVFANVTSTGTNYVTNNDDEEYGDTQGYLDLRGTGYSSIGKEAFKSNKSIKYFIAPSGPDFLIDESAFQSCANLERVDFSAVTGTLTIKSNAFASTKISTIIWPTSQNAVVNIEGTGVFSSCSSLTSVSLPVNLMMGNEHKLAGTTFYNCANLTTVTSEGTESNIVEFGGGAFQNCGNLNSFDFGKFSNLEIIGGSTFNGAGKLSSSGEISLPESLTKINDSGFKACKVLVVNITGDSIDMGATVFESSKIQALRFIKPDCDWGNNYRYGVFNSCTSLTELQLPNTFNINVETYDSTNNGKFFVSGDTIANIYLYEKIASNTTITDDWRSTTGNNQALAPTHFFVEDVNDLFNAGIISNENGGKVNNTSSLFWTTDANHHAVRLGSVTDYNGSVVTFQYGSLSGTTFTSGLIAGMNGLVNISLLGIIPSYSVNNLTIGYAFNSLFNATPFNFSNSAQNAFNMEWLSRSSSGSIEDKQYPAMR